MRIIGRLAPIAVVTLVALGAAACGEWSPSLSSPSGVPSALDSAPANGATIQGRVDGLTAGVSPMLASVTSSVSVKVVGTSISAPVSASGSFLLSSVPPGNIQLEFTSGGGIAIALVGNVAQGDRLDLKIRLVGSAAVVEAKIRIAIDDTTDVDGEITATSGTCPNLSFVVNGWTFKIDGSSVGDCTNIRVGVKVKIKGKMKDTRVVVVIRVVISNGRDDDSDSDKDSEARKKKLGLLSLRRQTGTAASTI